MQLFKNLFGGGEPTNVTAQEAQAQLKGDNPPFLLDVRQKVEFKSGHIPKAKLITLNELPNRLDELPKDRTILCVCQSGSRSGMARRQLAKAGFDVLNLRGGMMAWQRAGLPVK